MKKQEDLQQEEVLLNEEHKSSNNPFAPKNEETNTEIEPEETQPEENVEENQEVIKLKNDYENLHNQYIRLAADFDNYRKRQTQERDNLLQFGTQEALKKMIDVLDNFDRASQSCQKLEDADKIKECFSVLEKQTKDALSKMGLTEINTEGAEFDPNYHEAIMQTPTSEYAENSIINVLQKGYMYKDKVLRPSRVNVAVSE